MSAPTCVDAFCGAGGLSIGLTQAGFEVLLGFDNDALCIETIQSNSEVLNHKALKCDVREMLEGNLLDLVGIKAGELDLLAGGPPCQGFSVQRTIGEDSDDRNLLVSDYGDLIVESMPRFFLMENVVGIGGKRGRSMLDAFCEKMSKAGYYIHQTTVDASEFGVPQRRRRVIIVGERVDQLFQPCFKWPKTLSSPPPTVRDTIGHLPAPPTDCSDHPDLPGHRADKLSQRNQDRLRFLQAGQARTDLPDHLLADCHRVSADVVGHRNVYGRMEWDDVAPTITARFDSFTRGKFGHPEQIRSISLYEGALLQTFPQNYQFVGNKVDVARQIGNAVPPKLATALGCAILDALKKLSGKTTE